jgi:hypothetical protein
MVGFSMQDAAVGGFAAVREHPGVLMVWIPIALAISILVQVVSVGALVPGVDFAALTRDPDLAMAFVRRAMPEQLATLALVLPANAIVQAAMIRLVLRPADARFGYVRVGAGEARVLGVQLLIFLAASAAYLTVFLALAVIGSVLMAVAGLPMAAVIGLDFVVSVSAARFVAVRLSLAPAITFDRGRASLVTSWRLTHGRFWPIIGTYLLATALCAVIYAVAVVLIGVIGGIVLGSGLAEVMRPAQTLADLFSPLRLIIEGFGAFLAALIWPVLFTPSARIYASLAPSAGASWAARTPR